MALALLGHRSAYIQHNLVEVGGLPAQTPWVAVTARQAQDSARRCRVRMKPAAPENSATSHLRR